MKRIGPNTDPCGTPLVTSVQLDFSPLSTTGASKRRKDAKRRKKTRKVAKRQSKRREKTIEKTRKDSGRHKERIPSSPYSR